MQDSKNIKQTLDMLLSENDTVFIVPHNRPDFDAIGAAMGMSLICKKNKKRNYIVIDDDFDKLEPATRKVIEDIEDDFTIIKACDVPELMTDKSLMIAVDVNKDYLVSVKPLLGDFNQIFVPDHHKTDEHTINTPYLFVDDKLSSACEEVSRLSFLYGVKIDKNVANYLLAGIILDTNKLSKNTSSKTYEVASRLTSKGADAAIANNLFLEDFEHDRAIQKIVDNTCFTNYVFAIAGDKDGSGKIYQVEDIAKAADYLLKYQVNASFAMAYIDEDTISISARSKGLIDVASIMRYFGGGGNSFSAAARIKGHTLEEVKNALNQILTPCNYLDESSLKFDTEESGMKLTLRQK